MTIRIPDGNAFRIRLTARNLITGEYTEAADLSNIDNLVINYVRRGIRFPHTFTLDEEGRATVADPGTLDCGFYGIELTGYYAGEKFRFYGKDLFEITTDTTDVIDPTNLIDIEITVKLNASGVSKDYVDYAINGMEASMETMEADLRDEIAEAGKVDDVKVNGVSVVSNKKANITVPTKVSNLTNDSGFQNASQVQQKVDAAKITSVDISIDGGTGTPSGTAAVSNNQLVIALHNIKGETGQKGDAGNTGATGPQGATGVYDQNTQNFLTTLETTLGASQTKTMTQKAITDEFLRVRRKLGEFGEDLGLGLAEWKCCLSTDGSWVWKTSGTTSYQKKQRHSVIKVQAGELLILNSSVPQGTDLENASYAWLDENYVEGDQVGGSSIPFLTGTNVLTSPIGVEFMVVVPEGAEWLCLNRVGGSAKRTDWEVYKYDPSSSAIENLKEDAAVIKEDVQNIKDVCLVEMHYKTDPLKGYFSKGFMNASNVWTNTANANTHSSYKMPLAPSGTLKIVAQEGKYFHVEFVSEWPSDYGEPFVLATEERTDVKYGTQYLDIPDGATFLYIRGLQSGNDISPSYIGYVQDNNDVVENDAYRLDKVENSLGMLTGIVVKPKYATGGYTTDRGDFSSSTDKRSEWVTFDDNVERVTVVNPSPDKVKYIMYYRTCGQSSAPYEGGLTSSYITLDQSFVPVANTEYRLRAKALDDTAASLSNLVSSDYPFFRMMLKDATNIDSENNVGSDSRVKELIANAKYVHRSSESHTKSIGLLHFTDIHGNSVAAEQIKKWIAKYEGYIDDVLNTGDMCKSNSMDSSQSWQWWQNSGLAEKALTCLGNHDGAYKASQQATSDYDDVLSDWFWNGRGKAWDYEKYIAPYIDGWGVTMPDGYDDNTSPNYKACYYHKDYTEQKIRLIVLDCMHRFDGIVDPETGQPVEGSTGVKAENLTTEQEEWLVEKLNETLDNNDDAYGYSVVIACHYPLDDYTNYNSKPWAQRTGDYTDFNRNANGGVVMDYKTGEASNWQYSQEFPPLVLSKQFCLRNHGGVQGNYTKGDVNNIGNIIDAFIESGGKFVVWLAGHVHSNMLYYPDNYPNILVCANTSAGDGNGTDREDRVVNAVAANFVAIDTDNGLFKLVRLGLNTNKYLTPVNYICYDYINNKVISEG